MAHCLLLGMLTPILQCSAFAFFTPASIITMFLYALSYLVERIRSHTLLCMHTQKLFLFCAVFMHCGNIQLDVAASYSK